MLLYCCTFLPLEFCILLQKDPRRPQEHQVPSEPIDILIRSEYFIGHNPALLHMFFFLSLILLPLVQRVDGFSFDSFSPQWNTLGRLMQYRMFVLFPEYKYVFPSFFLSLSLSLTHFPYLYVCWWYKVKKKEKKETNRPVGETDGIP